MLSRIRDSLWEIVDPGGVRPIAVKVPEITALFWIAKVVSTAMGEALADWLDGDPNLLIAGLGAIVAAAGFVIALRRQFTADRYRTVTYWFAIAMVATFGTMVADAPHQFLGAPHSVITVVYALALAAIFWRWWINERTLSIHSIDTRSRERFYWATVLATFALGTAAGDWTAADLHLGFFASGLLFLGVIVIPAIAYRLGANPVFTFWFAYVITRPLGASFADWMDYGHNVGGLGWNRAPVWIALALAMAALVAVMLRRETARAPRPTELASPTPVSAGVS